MELSSLEHINHLSTNVIKYIRCAQEGSTGNAFIAFIYHFTIYSEKYHLDKDENINNLLKVMALAYERKDMLFVADILEYELMPPLNRLNNTL